MSKTYREYAIEYLKQGNLCKGYVDYILGEMAKLEKIERIVGAYTTDNPREPMYDTEDYMNSIIEAIGN